IQTHPRGAITAKRTPLYAIKSTTKHLCSLIHRIKRVLLVDGEGCGDGAAVVNGGFGRRWLNVVEWQRWWRCGVSGVPRWR
nr:hypothetical protein [Tanacetum cinerariifolium]